MKKLYRSSYIILLYPLFLGFLTSFSLPPYNYFILNFFTFSLFFIFIINQKYNKFSFFYFKLGWLFGFGYFISSLYWLSIALTFDADLKILIPVSLILIPSFLAIFYGLALYFFSYFLNYNNVSLALIFSMMFAIFEFLRGAIFSGFPWNLFVFTFSKTLEFIQVLSVIGTHSLNMICITLFLIPGIFILRKHKKEIYFCLFFLIMAVSFIIFGNYELKNQNLVLMKKHNFIIKVLSPKINIDRFYNVENEEIIIKDLINLSKPNPEVPTIFIWPEGIISSTNLNHIKIYEKLFKENFSKKHLIVLGINDSIYKNGKEKIYNSLVVLNNNLDIVDIYYKNNLVPFGEFLPFENYLNKVGLRSITFGYQSFSRGQKREIIRIQNSDFKLNFLPLICYEIIYSGKLSKESDYDLIINISEDGWFKNSIGTNQHFSQSIFRAIEEGKNIIRSTNNGISAYINSKGIILERMESTQSGVIEINNYKVPKKTFFSKHGNKIFFYLLLIYISFIFFINKFIEKEK